MANRIIRMVTNIVASHLSNNKLLHSEVPAFIESIYTTLEKIEESYVAKHRADTEQQVSAATSAHGIPPARELAHPGLAAAPHTLVTGDLPVAATREFEQRKVDGRTKEGRELARAQALAARQASAATGVAGVTNMVAPSTTLSTETVSTKPAPSMLLKEGQIDAERWPGVYPGTIVCLEDNVGTTLLRAYLKNRFDMTFEQYKTKWNLPSDYPYTPPEYAAKKREDAKAGGLGKKIRPTKRIDTPAAEPNRKPGTLSPSYRN